MHPSQGGIRGGAGGRGRGRGRGNIGRDRDLIGQTIKITQGPYKSHIGIVKVSELRCGLENYLNNLQTRAYA